MGHGWVTVAAALLALGSAAASPAEVSRGRALLDAGRVAAAISAMEDLLRHGDDADARLVLAAAYRRYGAGELALAQLEVAWRTRPAEAGVSAALVHQAVFRGPEARTNAAAALAIALRTGDRRTERRAREVLATLARRSRPEASVGALVALVAADASAGDEAGLVSTLSTLGETLLAAKQAAHAEIVFARAATLAEARGEVLEQERAWFGRARALVRLERWTDAEAPARRFVEVAARIEREAPSEEFATFATTGVRHGQELLVVALAARQRWEEALLVSDEMRARELRRALGGDTTEPLDGAGLRGLLDEGTVLVEYAFAAEHAYAWVVSRDRIVGLELPDAKRLRARGGELRALVSAPQLADAPLEAQLGALSAVLIAPLAPYLTGSRIAFVPDWTLRFVPFAALTFAGQPLMERFEVVVLPSASVLAAQRRSSLRPTARGVTVIADPVFDADDDRVTGALAAALPSSAARSTELVRLPYSRGEALAIAALGRDRHPVVALDFDAVRELVASRAVTDAEILHFATHGLSDEARPEASGLVFSRVDREGRAREGFLSAEVIAHLPLAARLVVLSACRTAVGTIVLGDGPLSLARAFLRAGVPRVVASLWIVDDAATATLMGYFYEDLFRHGGTPAAALRAAQRRLRAEPARHGVRHWAAFTHYGDWRY